MKPENDLLSLNNLARNVLLQYDIDPDKISVIQNNGLKTVWKITQGPESKCLKRLKQNKEKALFTVGAQIYIAQAGGAVPQVYLNREGNPVTEYMEQIFVLYEWIEGRDFSFARPADLRLALEGLAKFHVSSRGYTAPEGAKVSSKLGRWPHQYESMMSRMLKWKNEAAAKTENAVYKSYCRYIDAIAEMGNKALEALLKSSYSKLTDIAPEQSALCHQDYGEGNAILQGDTVYVLDLDGITYDLPVRDLRKIIGKRMEKLGRWDKKVIEDILLWYEKNNELSSEEKELLKIDLLFPHRFFGTVKNLFKKNKVLAPGEIIRIGEFELAKTDVLNDLF
ncbi:MAG: CotS family spore coat protein [Firmicutes bacterium]|nr:CotS family spore coat protein [Bacillota bacterium]